MKKTLHKLLRIGLTLRLVWRFAPWWTLVHTLLVMVLGFLPPVLLFLIKQIIDVIARGDTLPENPDLQWPLWVWILLLGIVGLLMTSIRLVSDWVSEVQSAEVTDGMLDLLGLK